MTYEGTFGEALCQAKWKVSPKVPSLDSGPDSTERAGFKTPPSLGKIARVGHPGPGQPPASLQAPDWWTTIKIRRRLFPSLFTSLTRLTSNGLVRRPRSFLISAPLILLLATSFQRQQRLLLPDLVLPLQSREIPRRLRQSYALPNKALPSSPV